MLPDVPIRPRRLGVRLALLFVAASMLAACDKCGDSIFHADAGRPLACKGGAPH